VSIMGELGKSVPTIRTASSSLKERPGHRGQTGIMAVAGRVQRKVSFARFEIDYLSSGGYTPDSDGDVILPPLRSHPNVLRPTGLHALEITRPQSPSILPSSMSTHTRTRSPSHSLPHTIPKRQHQRACMVARTPQ
jgi:hypothetical protein